MKRPRFELEDEITFAFEAAAADQVLDGIWPEKEYLNVDGVTFWRRSVTISRSVHLFLQPDVARDKSRIKVEAVGKKLRFTSDEKTYAAGRKYERTAWTAQGKQARKKLRKAGLLIGALAKERVSLHYRATTRTDGRVRERKMKASIDRMRILDGAGQPVDTLPLFHLDLEGDGAGLQADFVSSSFFRMALAPTLEPLVYNDSKWLVAAKHLAAPVAIGEMAFEEVSRLVRRGLASLDC